MGRLKSIIISYYIELSLFIDKIIIIKAHFSPESLQLAYQERQMFSEEKSPKIHPFSDEKHKTTKFYCLGK